MCRGRHRVENRVGVVQARGGAGRGGAGGGYHGTSVAPSPGNYTCLCSVTKSRAHHLTAVLPKFHNVRMAPTLDDFPTLQVLSVHGTCCIRVEHMLNICRGCTVARSLWWRISGVRAKQVEACESCDLRPPTLEVSWHAKLRPIT